MDAINENGRPAGRGWPWGIAGAYLVFVSLALGFAAFAFTQRVDLVSPDYYQEEIAHQEHIDRVQRTRALPDGEGWSAVLDGGLLAFSYATGRERVPLEGTIHFYRPDDPRLDRKYAIALDGQGRQALPAADFAPGAWRAKIRWTMGGAAYYDEIALRVE